MDTWIVLIPVLVTGGVGFGSAVLSYLLARRQLTHQRLEHESSRNHQIDLLLVPKRLHATERLWQLLWAVEANGSLTPDQLDDLILTLMWLPEDIQSGALAIHQELATGQSVEPTEVTAVRQRLIDVTGIARIADARLLASTF